MQKTLDTAVRPPPAITRKTIRSPTRWDRITAGINAARKAALRESGRCADPRALAVKKGLAALVEAIGRVAAADATGLYATIETRPATSYRGAQICIEFDAVGAAFTPDEERELREVLQAKQREIVARRR